MEKTYTFTISETTSGFAIGAKHYNVKCRANKALDHINVPQAELFNVMRYLTEALNAGNIAVLFEID